MRRDVLGTCPNGRLADSTAGRNSGRHLAEHHRSSPCGSELGRVAEEITEDRQAFLDLMQSRGVTQRRHKAYAGWGAEKGGLLELKKGGLLELNASVTRRSGLSTLIELETLRLGIEGKALLWRTLLSLTPHRALDEAQLNGLLERAGEQADTVEAVRRQTAAAGFR